MSTAAGSDRTVQIGVSVDTSTAETGLHRLGQTANAVGVQIGAAGEKAGAGIDKIGAGAPAAGEKIDRATRSIISSIERTTAALRTGGAQSAEYFELLARQRGISGTTLDPYIKQLKQAEEAQKLAGKSLGSMELTAKQTTAALRGVPAQFADIIVSLQGGQAPLTVLLQQGGQLKDMFGGVGAAARALGGYVAGLINPFTVAAGAGVALAVAYQKGAEEAHAFERALITSGNQSGVTGNQLAGMAASIDLVVGTQSKAAEVLTLLAQSGTSGAAGFERLATAAIAFEQAGGQAAEKTVEAFVEMGKEPLKAVIKLNEAQGFLTAATYEQIKALDEQGKTTEAAKVAQEAYAAALEQRTPAMLQQLGTLERGWLAIKNATKEAGDAILSVGRARDPLTQVQEELAKLQENQAGARSDNKDKYQPAIDALSRQLLMLDKVAVAEAERAKDKATEIRLVKEKIDWDKRGADVADKAAKRDKELIAEAVKGRELINRGLITEEDLKKRLLAITEKYKEAEKKPTGPKPDEYAGERELAKLWAADFKKMRDEATKAEASFLGLSKAQEGLLMFLKSDAYQGASEPMRELVLQEAYAAVAFEQSEAAAKENAKALKALEKTHADYIKELEKDAEAATKRLATLKQENEAAEIAKASNISLAEAIELVALARLQEQQAAEMSFGDEAAVQAIQNEIAARRELMREIRTKDVRKADEDAAKDAAKEWEKASQKIEDTLTDALMRGFESGKGFAEALRDTVVNMFKTLVLKPIVSAIVSPVAAALTGAIAPTAASAGTSLVGSAASSAAGSALLGGTSLAAVGESIGTGFMATISGQSIGAAASAYSAAGSTGVSMGLQIGAAAPYALAAAAVLAALGAFRTTKTVGGGLQGTLGEGDITGYDLRRKSGYLLGGPDYSIRDTGVSAQSAQLQSSFETMRTSSVAMADALGLGSDAIKGFTTTIGTELIHPDTGGLGLKFDGLNEQQVQEKIATALGAANDQLAAEILGIQTTVVTSTTRMVEEAVGPIDEWGQSSATAFREVTDSITSTNVTARKDLLPWMQRLVDLGGPTAATLQKLYTYSDELLTQAGTSRDALVKLYAEGFRTGDIEGAGQAVADTLVTSIENTMLTSAAAQIFDIANRGIITPIIDAMLTGQTLSQALADGAIESTITKIKDKATALATILNDPRIKDLMDGLKTSLGGALGAGAGVGYTPQYQPQPMQITKPDAAAEAAQEAADAARKAWQDITDGLLEDGEQLRIDLLRAQGSEAAALEAERTRAIKGMDAYQVGLYDANQALIQQIALIEKNKQAMLDFWSAADQAAGALLSGDTLTQYQTGRIADNPELVKLGLTADVLGGQSADSIRALTLAYVTQSDASTESKTAVLNAASALLQLRDTADGLVESFYSAADQAAGALLSGDTLTKYRVQRIASQLPPELGITAADLSAQTPESVRQLVTAFAQLPGVSTEARTSVLSLGSALIQIMEASNQRLLGLQKEGQQLDAQLLGATGNTLAMQSALRALDIEGFSPAEIAAYDYNASLKAQIATQNEQTALVKNLDAAIGDSAKIRQAEIEAIDDSNRALQQMIWAVQDTAAGVDNALAAVGRAVEAEKAAINKSAEAEILALQKQIDTTKDAAQAAEELTSTLGGMVDGIAQAVRALRNQSTPDAMRYSQAQAFIASATVLAKMGARPDEAALSDALAALTSATDEDAVSVAEFRYQQAVQAGAVSDLGDALGKQLTDAQKTKKAIDEGNLLAQEQIKTIQAGTRQQLDALDATYRAAQDQVAILRGVDVSVISVRDAVTGLGSAIGSAVSAVSAARAVSAAVAMPAPKIAAPAVSSPPPLPPAEYNQDVRDAAQALMDAQGKEALYDVIKGTGYTMQQADTILGLSAGTIEAEAEKLGLPKFAAGGMHTGGWALVGEKGPEVAYLPPSQIFDAQQTTKMLAPTNTTRLENLVETLIFRIMKLESVNERTANAVNGNPEAPMLVEIA